MTTAARWRYLLFVSPLLALPALTGCLATYGQDQAEQQAAVREDMALVQEQNRRLQGRLEGVELQIEGLQRSMDALRNSPSGPSQSDVMALQARVVALENQLKAIDAAREKDRQEIINTLSGKLSQIMSSSSAAARPKAATASTTRKTNGPQEGYEHVVEAGQTLSAIASAYGVSSKSIVEANNLTRPDQLRVGQKLFIPAP